MYGVQGEQFIIADKKHGKIKIEYREEQHEKPYVVRIDRRKLQHRSEVDVERIVTFLMKCTLFNLRQFKSLLSGLLLENFANSLNPPLLMSQYCLMH